jgi:hypothetical protein
MVFNAILNALKSGLQRDPQRIEERSSTRGKVGLHFSFITAACRRTYNGLAC